jgi:hypothetical protein
MRLELERGFKLFSNKIEGNYHSSYSFVLYIVALILTFVALQFAHPMTQKSFNLGSKPITRSQKNYFRKWL